jgi:hypothetical protein
VLRTALAEIPKTEAAIPIGTETPFSDPFKTSTDTLFPLRTELPFRKSVACAATTTQNDFFSYLLVLLVRVCGRSC